MSMGFAHMAHIGLGIGGVKNPQVKPEMYLPVKPLVDKESSRPETISRPGVRRG